MICQHAACRCNSTQFEDQDSQFCSDYCRDHAAQGDSDSMRCECGHDACS